MSNYKTRKRRNNQKRKHNAKYYYCDDQVLKRHLEAIDRIKQQLLLIAALIDLIFSSKKDQIEQETIPVTTLFIKQQLIRIQNKLQLLFSELSRNNGTKRW